MKHVSINCPYCGARIANGIGDIKIPQVFVPFYRCICCGKLMITGGQEFLTMNPDYRCRIKSSLQNCQNIAESIDRTNSKEYVDFLNNHGFEIYPITKAEVDRFQNVDFSRYGRKTSKSGMETLYNMGVLIHKEDLDEKTGTYKQEILDKNTIHQKSMGTSALLGLLIGFLSFILYMTIYATAWNILFALLTGAAGAFLAYLLRAYMLAKSLGYDMRILKHTHKNKTKKNKEEQRKYYDKRQDIELLKELFEDGVITKEEYKETALDIIDKKK